MQLWRRPFRAALRLTTDDSRTGARAALIALALLLAPALAAQQAALTRFQYEEPHMGTTFRVVIHAPDQASAGAASRGALGPKAALEGTRTHKKGTSERSRGTVTFDPVSVADPEAPEAA